MNKLIKLFLHRAANDADILLEIRKKYIRGGVISARIPRLIYNQICYRNNCYISTLAQIGDGIVFPHGVCGIFISDGAVIGKNVVIFHQVTVGSNTLKDTKKYGAPEIGDSVYIGCGAKIIGGITIGDNVRVGANAVVVKDIPANSTVFLSESVVIEHDENRDNSFYQLGKQK